jgi:hypothetical protein
MDAVSLSALVADLLVAIHSLSTYPAAVPPPAIRTVPVAEIHRRFCNEPCRVQAYYLPDEGIFIDESLDVAGDGFARSILLHELVHHHQRMKGTFSRIPHGCDRWYRAEEEAYEIQNLYLESINSARRVYIQPWKLTCG